MTSPLVGPRIPIAVRVMRINTVHFFFARFEPEIMLHVPVCEPMTDDGRFMVELLRRTA